MQLVRSNNLATLVLLLHLIVGVLSIFVFNGTGDDGDSIYHYLYAKYAPFYPELYFDHWAKPLYVLLASPFAQFGFIGVKTMNFLLVHFTLVVTFRIVNIWNKDSPSIVLLVLFCMPLYYILTFSGLTEPLFAFLLSVIIWLWLRRKIFWAVIFISFLPFVRSEGLFFIGIFGMLILFKKQWKYLPFLLLGSLFYGVMGATTHGDILWVFEKVPYAKLSSTYGEGDFLHYFEQLIYVVGVPLYILFWVGVLNQMLRVVKDGITEYTYLVYGSVLAFFIAHSVFWYFGVFNSMGLKRVLLAIVPLMAIICLDGFNVLRNVTSFVSYRFSMIFSMLLVVSIVVFPFTDNKAAIDFQEDMQLSEKQMFMQQIGTIIISDSLLSEGRLVTAYPYACEVLNVNCFEPKEKVFLTKPQLEELSENDIVIWENWFAPVEQGVYKDDLRDLKQLFFISSTDRNGTKSEIIVAKKKH